MATYIIRAGENGPVKIGRAADPEQRMADLQTGHPDELVMLRIIDTAFDAEKAFHAQFSAQHIRGEWFRFSPEMMTFVPPEPEAEQPIAEIVALAKRRAVQEAEELIVVIWQHFRGIETKGQFMKRIARMLQIKERRIYAMMYGQARRVDVHEIEGLRAIAKKLRREASGVGPLFSNYEHVPAGTPAAR